MRKNRITVHPIGEDSVLDNEVMADIIEWITNKIWIRKYWKVNEKKASDYFNELGVDFAGAYMYMLENC